MVTRVKGDASRSVLQIDWVKRLFPAHYLGRADYALGVATLIACFFLFFHGDLPAIGFCSLSYLFGGAREFYENAAKATAWVGSPICTYPPSTYALLALWLYPLKVFGLIPSVEQFPTFATYWLKSLTTLSYAASGAVFYRIARVYWHDEEWAKYATAAWLTMPLAVFSQFIFSQVDIFNVLLSLLGILMFLKGRLYLGALFFGLSITFKYFPAFVFLPLVLLFEKRIARIALGVVIFITPIALMELFYHRSPAYLTLTHNFVEVDRVYSVSMRLGGPVQIYLLFTAFTVLCGIAYFTIPKGDMQLRTAAYLWLAASILPFLFIFWHPQWLIFVSPAIVLTSVLSQRFRAHVLLDLFGMFLFIAAVSLLFPDNVDVEMFHAGWLGVSFDQSFLMAQLFDWFGGHSAGVFLSGFTGYLILQLVVKLKLVISGPNRTAADTVHYGYVRRYLYIGLLIFVLPASVAMYKDKLDNELVVRNELGWSDYGELLSGRTFEQTFIAPAESLRWVSLLLTTFDRQNNSGVVMAILDAHGERLTMVERRASDLKNGTWNRFAVHSVSLNRGEQYRIRLTSTNAVTGDAISWMACMANCYDEGQAIVDGAALKSDFAFRIGFAR